MAPRPATLRARSQAGIAVGLVGVLLALAVLGGVRPFHGCFHGAGGDDPFCLVCLFARGQVEAPAVGLVLAGFVLAFSLALRPVFTAVPAPNRSAAVRERAPPFKPPQR